MKKPTKKPDSGKLKTYVDNQNHKTTANLR